MTPRFVDDIIVIELKYSYFMKVLFAPSPYHSLKINIKLSGHEIIFKSYSGYYSHRYSDFFCMIMIETLGIPNIITYCERVSYVV